MRHYIFRHICALKIYLQTLGTDDGEKLHNLRAGCAVKLAMGGESVQEDSVMSHIGWPGTNIKWLIITRDQRN